MERDKFYDNYMNSQECLYGPGSEFLSQYTLLLRARDLHLDVEVRSEE